MLPRIKYRNPALPISINRHAAPDGPALLHIYTSPLPSDSSNPSAPRDADAKPTHSLNMRDVQPVEILEQIAETTGSPNGGRMTRAGILGTAEFAVVHLSAKAPHRILAIETHSAPE